MDIFGIGPLELVFIFILVIIIFGPKDLMKTGKTIGKSMNKFIRSDTWKTINQTTQELKNLPNRLMREAGLEELEQMKMNNLTPSNQTILPPADEKEQQPSPQVNSESPADSTESGSTNPPDKDVSA